MDVRVLGAFAMVAVCAMAGCGGGSPADDGPAGSIHGMIVMVGGPPGASPAGAPGTVVVRRDGTEVARQGLAEGQEFRFSVSQGRYRLAVQGVDGACVDTDVTVTAAEDRAVELVCRRK